ncbi:MAG TPA: hypothetical protein PK765_05105 [bacterium]|nr:hypothetical protein [bacterium]
MSSNALLDAISSEDRPQVLALAKRFEQNNTPLSYFEGVFLTLAALEDRLLLIGARIAFDTLRVQRVELFRTISMKHVPSVAKASWQRILSVFDRAESGMFFERVEDVRTNIADILSALKEIRSPSDILALSPNLPDPSDLQLALTEKAAEKLTAAASPFHVPSGSDSATFVFSHGARYGSD